MAETKLLVIIGVTGQQGGSVAQVFQREPGWRIRGITRDPTKASNASLRESGVELVAGDLDDTSSLVDAFTGADAIFSVTDFWQFLKPGSSTFAEAAKAQKPANQLALEKEVQQGKNIIDAAAQVHAQKPLHRFVISTLSDSRKWSKGAIQWNLHFDGKAQYVEYLQSTHPDLAARASYLQVGFYLSNWKSFPMWAPRKIPDGTGELIIYPTAGNPDGEPTPFVNPPNDTGHFVRALILSPKSPPGTTMLGYCRLMKGRAYVELWGETLGVQARVHQSGYEDMVKAGVPDWLAKEVSESGTYVSTYGWDGKEPGVKSPEEGGVEIIHLTKLEDWIKEEDWSSVL